jgi:hypothetical protein
LLEICGVSTRPGCHHRLAPHRKYHQYRSGRWSDGRRSPSPGWRASASLLCTIRLGFRRPASPYPIQDIFRHLEMVDPFLILLGRHDLRCSDQLARGDTRNPDTHHFLQRRVFSCSDRGFGNDDQSVFAVLAIRRRSRTNGK